MCQYHALQLSFWFKCWMYFNYFLSHLEYFYLLVPPKSLLSERRKWSLVEDWSLCCSVSVCPQRQVRQKLSVWQNTVVMWLRQVGWLVYLFVLFLCVLSYNSLKVISSQKRNPCFLNPLSLCLRSQFICCLFPCSILHWCHCRSDDKAHPKSRLIDVTLSRYKTLRGHLHLIRHCQNCVLLKFCSWPVNSGCEAENNRPGDLAAVLGKIFRIIHKGWTC